MVESLEIKRWNFFNNIDYFIGGPYNPQHQGDLEIFNKNIHKKNIYQLGSSRGEFLLSWFY